jgi:hypothetical protein
MIPRIIVAECPEYIPTTPSWDSYEGEVCMAEFDRVSTHKIRQIMPVNDHKRPDIYNKSNL